MKGHIIGSHVVEDDEEGFVVGKQIFKKVRTLQNEYQPVTMVLVIFLLENKEEILSAKDFFGAAVESIPVVTFISILHCLYMFSSWGGRHS